MFGFLNINKPSGITSSKIISILRKITGIKQIGHAGTLDPLASGVLPVAIGKAVKLIDYMDEDKCYIVGMYLGKTSDTYDTDGIVKSTEFRNINKEEIESVLKEFIGNLNQIPPAFSAVHYNGKRLYELARKGQIPDNIPLREISVYKNKLIEFDHKNQILKLDISCSKGTYIRSIVNDIGNRLGCGGVMFELIRTKSSGMSINNSIDITSSAINAKDIEMKLIPPQNLLKIPIYNILDNEFKKLQNGNKFKNNTNLNGNILLLKNNIIAALAFADNEFIHPKKVLL